MESVGSDEGSSNAPKLKQVQRQQVQRKQK